MNFKFYKFVPIILLCPLLIIGQEFDQAFLDSLPEEIAEDLKTRVDEKANKEETQYRRPSSFIEKPDEDSNRFGVKIFSLMQTSLMPINEPNLDSSYVMDFGDELELQLIGKQSSITKLVVKRDGSINISDIGKIFIAGLTLEESVRVIKAKIEQSLIGYDAYITLTNVRDIQVIVAGNVYNPGPYTLNGNSNMFHALVMAGGPSESGSFRSIKLIRNNEVIETMDLYQTFIYAKYNFNTRLRSGDMIFVNPVNNILNVNGGVKRPGEYELLADEKLSSIIEFANGIDKFADLSNISLQRIVEGEIKSIPVSNIDELNEIIAKDGDNLFIRNHTFRSVKISGAVLNPGSYLMVEGQNAFDAIEKAGGYTENAYPFGAVYENLATKEINEMALEALYETFLDNIIKLTQENVSSEMNFAPLIQLTSELKETEPSGRVIVDFENNDSSKPIKIQDGDSIHIPELSNQIYIYGEISNEGAAVFVEGAKIDDYFANNGGLTEEADLDNIFVLHPNGVTEKASVNRNLFANQTREIQLYPGSVIFVPRVTRNNMATTLKAQAYATILGNIGVSLASLSVLKD